MVLDGEVRQPLQDGALPAQTRLKRRVGSELQPFASRPQSASKVSVHEGEEDYDRKDLARRYGGVEG